MLSFARQSFVVSLFSQMDPVGMGISIVLILVSVYSWAVILERFFFYRSTERGFSEFERLFRSSRNLADVSRDLKHLPPTPLHRPPNPSCLQARAHPRRRRPRRAHSRRPRCPAVGGGVIPSARLLSARCYRSSGKCFTETSPATANPRPSASRQPRNRSSFQRNYQFCFSDRRKRRLHPKVEQDSLYSSPIWGRRCARLRRKMVMTQVARGPLPCCTLHQFSHSCCWKIAQRDALNSCVSQRTRANMKSGARAILENVA